MERAITISTNDRVQPWIIFVLRVNQVIRPSSKNSLLMIQLCISICFLFIVSKPDSCPFYMSFNFNFKQRWAWSSTLKEALLF